MKKINFITLASTAILIIFLLPSCVEEEFSGATFATAQEFTHLKVYLTSSSIEAEEVNIDIRKIRIRTDIRDVEFEIATFSNVYSLLQLQDTNSTLIAESHLLDTEFIYQLSLELGNNNTILIDGKHFPLVLAENAKDLLNIHCNLGLSRTLIQDVLLDFDAAKSILSPAEGIYLLQPHIRIMD